MHSQETFSIWCKPSRRQHFLEIVWFSLPTRAAYQMMLMATSVCGPGCCCVCCIYFALETHDCSEACLCQTGDGRCRPTSDSRRTTDCTMRQHYITTLMLSTTLLLLYCCLSCRARRAFTHRKSRKSKQETPSDTQLLKFHQGYPTQCPPTSRS